MADLRLSLSLNAVSLYLSILFLILLSRATLQSQDVSSSTKPDTKALADNERQQNEQVVERFFQHLEALDIDAFMTLWAKDGQQIMPFAPEGFPDTLSGKEAIYRQYQSLPDNYRSMEFPREIMPMKDPNRFVVQYRGIIPLADNGEYNNDYIALFVLEDGKIKTYYEYFNPIILQETFGEALQENFNTRN